MPSPDYLSLLMLLAYKPLISRAKSTSREVSVWSEGATAQLQDCFECTDWSLFVDSDLDQYTSSVLLYINFCTENVTTVKKIHDFPNEKLWLNNKVRNLLRLRDAAYRANDITAYNLAKSILKCNIKEAKNE